MKRCFLIGKSLKQSYSKEIHEKLNNYYELLELDDIGFVDFVNGKEYEMVNVTMPYKRIASSLCDKLDVISEKTTVVNTIINKNGKLYGYNTDYYGFSLLAKGYDYNNKNILILGTGATKDTITYYFEQYKNVNLFYASTTKSNDATIFKYDNLDEFYETIDVIVNATPIGTYPNCYECLIDIKKFKKLSLVLDVIYNPINSQLVSSALASGIEARGGLLMLIAQAVKANAILKEIDCNINLINKLYNELLYNKQNVVLIGLPGSGKSSIGELLSIYSSKPLLDTDSLIEEEIGETILEYFEDHEEAEFRKIESKIINKVSVLQGNIISTGGGVVLNEANMISLKMNGKIYFIDRNISNIEIGTSRPLTTNVDELLKLDSERRNLYLKYADVVLDNNSSIEAIVRKVME